MEGLAFVVTGGGLGIGREICRVLAGCHCKVVVCDILLDKANEVVRELDEKHGEGTAVGYKCDVTEIDQVRQCIYLCSKKFGRFDGIVNNAGIGESDPYRWYKKVKNENQEEKDVAEFKKILDIDIFAVALGTYVALQEFKRTGTDGIVVNIASMGGILPMPTAPVYAAAKAAVINLTRSLSLTSTLQMGEDEEGGGGGGLGKVVAVCPSLTETRLMTAMRDQTDDGGEQMKKELGGFLSVQDIAEGVRIVIKDLVDGTVGSGEVMRVTYRGGYDYWTPGKKTRRIKPVLSVSAKL